jgi:hypothetical protein
MAFATLNMGGKCYADVFNISHHLVQLSEGKGKVASAGIVFLVGDIRES